MKSKIKALYEKYGNIAIVAYLAVFFMTFFAFFGLISMGFSLQDYSSWFSELPTVGIIPIAYAATKLTQPIRIALCLVLIPIVYRMRYGKAPDSSVPVSSD